MSVLTQQYAKFLNEQFNWKYFLTARTPYKINTSTPMNWSYRLLGNNKVDNIFYVVERDKGDWSNKHVHMLVETNMDMYGKMRSGRDKIAGFDVFAAMKEQADGLAGKPINMQKWWL